MAKQIFAANKLTGGVAGALDDINHTALEDGNIALVIDASTDLVTFYKYDASEAGGESSPDLIIPDSNSTGTGAWVLEDVYSYDLTVGNNLSVQNDADIDGDLNVDGAAVVDGALTAASLELGGSGAVPTEFSTDGTMAGDSDTAVPTEKAVKTYVDQKANANILINGNLDIWQRATSQTTSGYGSADRWKFDFVGGSQSTQRLALNQTQAELMATGASYYVTNTVSGKTNVGDYALIQQKIEDVTKYAGETLTLSFWSYMTGAVTLGIEIGQNFGSGGSTAVFTHCGTISCADAVWENHSITFDVPSVVGKTIGTDNNMGMVIWLSAGSTYDVRSGSIGHQNTTFRFASLKLEKGSVATPFVARHLAEEVAMCQRYFSKSYSLATAVGSSTSVGAYANRYASALAGHWVPVRYPVEMRKTPTVEYYSLVGTASSVSAVTTSMAHSADTGISGIYNQGSSGNCGPLLTASTQYIAWQWTADAEL